MSKRWYPQCTRYSHGVRCTNDARTRLLAPPYVTKVKGAYMCRECAKIVLSEYAQKLGQMWLAEDIDEHGEIIGWSDSR